MTEPWKPSDEKKAVVILPNGNKFEVRASAPFVETVNEYARGAGLSKLSITVDGKDIDRSEAPENFSDVCIVELKKYDEGS